jgi:AcrR family transcriptional regulator
VAVQRRARASTEQKRLKVLDATEEIMLEHGYAAVSSRSVAARVGINAPLIHYYFPTLDDLFLAVLDRRAGRNVELMAAALDADEPLLTWWRLVSNRRGGALFLELLAASNHRPLLRAQVGELARTVRQFQVERLSTLLAEYDLDPEQFPPVLVAATMQGLGFGLVQDQVAGHDTGTDEVAAAVTKLLTRMEQHRRRRSSE